MIKKFFNVDVYLEDVVKDLFKCLIFFLIEREICIELFEKG